MDWSALNHALLAHLPVASGLLLPWALVVAQRPGRGIRPWWTVARYLGWMGFGGLLLAFLSGLLEAKGFGLLSGQRWLPALWGQAAAPQNLLARHVLLALVSLPLAGLALWSMNRSRKDHQSLGWLALGLGLLWSAALLMTGRQGYQLAHGVARAPALASIHAPVPSVLTAPNPVKLEAPGPLPLRALDYGALESIHAEPVKSTAHGGRWIRVWISPEAAPAYRLGQPLPTGALVVMSSQEDRWGRPSSELGPLYVLEQQPQGPSLSFYWPRIPLDQRQAFGGESRVLWRGEEAPLQACRPCHAQGPGNPAQRSRWRVPRSVSGAKSATAAD